MPRVGFILIPFDGGRETHLSTPEAKSQQVIDNPVAETRLSELVDQRPAMEGVKFMFTQGGVLMHGTDSQALVMSRLVHDLPNLTPSTSAQVIQFASAASANDERFHIGETFGNAARRFNVAPMQADFVAAAHDKAAPFMRGSRPSISGSHMRLAA